MLTRHLIFVDLGPCSFVCSSNSLKELNLCLCVHAKVLMTKEAAGWTSNSAQQEWVLKLKKKEMKKATNCLF